MTLMSKPPLMNGIQTDLWHLLCLQIELGKKLKKLKVKRAWQKGLDASVSWREFCWQPQYKITERYAQEVIYTATLFEKRKLRYEDIKGCPNRRELIEGLKDRNWKDKIIFWQSLL